MMTPREQAIVRMHNAGLIDAEIVAVMAMRGDQAAEECISRQGRYDEQVKKAEDDLQAYTASLGR